MVDWVAGWPQATWWRPTVRAVAVAGPLLTCGILSTVRGNVTAATSVLVLVVWVVAAAATGDRPAAVLAALSAGLWYDFFLTVPYARFTIDDPDDVEATVLLVVISLAVSEIALWGRRQHAHAARRSGYLDGVVHAARTAAEGHASAKTLVDVVGRNIVDVLGAEDFRYVEGPVYDARITTLDHDGVLTRAGRPVDVERNGLPTDEYVAVLVQRGPAVLAHFLLTATSRSVHPTSEQRRVAVVLADQLAGVLNDRGAT